MFREVKDGSSEGVSPVSTAILATGPHLYTVKVARPAASGETDDIARQTHDVLSQLRDTLARAGGTMADVAQVTVYLVCLADAEAMNDVYRTYFKPPYPNRATVVVAALRGDNRLIEIVVHAHPGASKDSV